jgi:hypothetical protein
MAIASGVDARISQCELCSCDGKGFDDDIKFALLRPKSELSR